MSTAGSASKPCPVPNTRSVIFSSFRSSFSWCQAAVGVKLQIKLQIGFKLQIKLQMDLKSSFIYLGLLFAVNSVCVQMCREAGDGRGQCDHSWGS